MVTAVVPAVPRPRAATRAGRRDDVHAIVLGTRTARLVYQPLVDLHRGTAVGFEALARFTPRTSTSPGPWFAAAVDTPDAAPLEAVLVAAALEGRSALPLGCYVSINVTPALLSSREVLRAFGTGGDLSDVVVELTEHARFGHGGELAQAVTALRQRGARFALDDVGVGWAGLKQVVDLRPEIVKLDRSLVVDAPRDPVRQAIAQMLLDLCSRLGIDLLVEGVETYEELDLFARMGVPLAQGFVFGQPQPVARQLIDDDLAVRLKFRAGLVRHRDKIAGHVDVAGASVRVGDSGTLQPRGAAVEEMQPVVLLDGTGRPVALAVGEVQHPVMTVSVAEDVAGAAQRAMTRPASERFLPLVCVDRAGRYVGVVAVESLVLALADGAAEPHSEVRLP